MEPSDLVAGVSCVVALKPAKNFSTTTPCRTDLSE